MRRFTIGHQNSSSFDTKYTHNRLKNAKKWPKMAQKKDFVVQNPHFNDVVPPARIELAIDPYHGSVIPLN